MDKESLYKSLYEDYFAAFCLYAKRYVQSDAVSQDIVSEVFARLWFKGERFILIREKALSFLKTSVKNSCIDFLRHDNVARAYSEKHTFAAPSYADSPEQIYSLNELYALLEEAVEALPEKYRVVYTENIVDEKPVCEVARALGVSVRSVERYRASVMEILRTKLADYLPLLFFLYILGE